VGILVLLVLEILLGFRDLGVGVTVVALGPLPQGGLGRVARFARAGWSLGLLGGAPAAHAGERGNGERGGNEQRKHGFPTHEDLERWKLQPGGRANALRDEDRRSKKGDC